MDLNHASFRDALLAPQADRSIRGDPPRRQQARVESTFAASYPSRGQNLGLLEGVVLHKRYACEIARDLTVGKEQKENENLVCECQKQSCNRDSCRKLVFRIRQNQTASKAKSDRFSDHFWKRTSSLSFASM